MKNKSKNYWKTVRRGLKYSTVAAVAFIALAFLLAKISYPVVFVACIFETFFFYCLAVYTTFCTAEEEEKLLNCIAEEEENLRIYLNDIANKSQEYSFYQDKI